MRCGSCVRELRVFREGQLEATFRPGQGTRIAGLHVPEITVDCRRVIRGRGASLLDPRWGR